MISCFRVFVQGGGCISVCGGIHTGERRMLSVLFYHSLSYSLEPCRGLVSPGNPQSLGFSCAQPQQLLLWVLETCTQFRTLAQQVLLPTQASSQPLYYTLLLKTVLFICLVYGHFAFCMTIHHVHACCLQRPEDPLELQMVVSCQGNSGNRTQVLCQCS